MNATLHSMAAACCMAACGLAWPAENPAAAMQTNPAVSTADIAAAVDDATATNETNETNEKNKTNASALHRQTTQLRFTAESVELPQREQMGLLGVNYLFDLGQGFYAGPAVYGAVAGQRGGFFTIGGELGWRLPLSSCWSVQSGLYAGGGGGGSAPVGGGLMIRPHVDLMWHGQGYQLGLSATQVHFPNGNIDSRQLGLVLAMDDHYVYTGIDHAGQSISAPRGGLGFDRMALAAGVYKPSAGLNTVGNPYASSIAYAGFRAERQINPHWYWGLETGAAASGGADGYAEFLGMLGAEYPAVPQRLSFGARVAAGMGGGGRLNVGGGTAAKAALYAKIYAHDDHYLQLEWGQAWAPDGHFKAPYGMILLGMNLDAPSAENLPRAVRGTEWSIGAIRYIRAARYSGSHPALDAVALKMTRYLHPNFYLTGQAHSAVAGGAGGFSAGFAGAGVVSPPLAGALRAGAEIMLGAAGGGGVHTQGGAASYGDLYAAYDLSQYSRIKLAVGQIKSLKGQLNSPTIELLYSAALGIPGR